MTKTPRCKCGTGYYCRRHLRYGVTVKCERVKTQRAFKGGRRVVREES